MTKPLLEVGKFYKRTWGYKKEYSQIIYIEDMTDHTWEGGRHRNYSYFGISENTRHPQTQCDCGQYYWEEGYCNGRERMKSEIWEPLSDIDSIFAASKLFSTEIRKKFCLPLHPTKVKWAVHCMEMEQKYHE